MANDMESGTSTYAEHVERARSSADHELDRSAVKPRRHLKASRRAVVVGGYVRSDGTYVSGHYRAAR